MVALRETQKNSENLVRILASHLPTSTSSSSYQVSFLFFSSFLLLISM